MLSNQKTSAYIQQELMDSDVDMDIEEYNTNTTIQITERPSNNSMKKLSDMPLQQLASNYHP